MHCLAAGLMMKTCNTFTVTPFFFLERMFSSVAFRKKKEREVKEKYGDFI